MCPLGLVFEIVADSYDAFLGVAKNRNFGLRVEELCEIFFPIGEQQRADARRLVEPHVVRIRAGDIDVRVHRYPRSGQNAKHVDPPDGALIGASNGRIVRQLFDALPPNPDGNVATQVFEPFQPARGDEATDCPRTRRRPSSRDRPGLQDDRIESQRKTARPSTRLSEIARRSSAGKSNISP